MMKSTMLTMGPSVRWACCYCIATFLTFTLAANAGEPFELMTHETDVYGTRDVESGNFEEGIRKLMTRLPGNRQPHSVRTPILIDLCVAHTMERNMSEATQYCDQATESGWSAGLAYNNRGVLNIAKGDYESAIRDFQMAIKSRGADAVAKRNLGRSQTRLADIRSQHKEQRVAVVLGVQ